MMPSDAALSVAVWQHPPPNLPKPPVGVSRLLPSTSYMLSFPLSAAVHGDRHALPCPQTRSAMGIGDSDHNELRQC